MMWVSPLFGGMYIFFETFLERDITEFKLCAIAQKAYLAFKLTTCYIFFLSADVNSSESLLSPPSDIEMRSRM